MIAQFVISLMNEKKLGISEIDQICTDFEQGWSWTSIEAIREIAVMGRLADEAYADLFCELVQIDLEQRWLLKCEELKVAESSDVRDLRSTIKFPSLDFYLAFPHTDTLPLGVKDQLAECEVRCLAHYGSGDVENHPKYSIRLDKYLPKVGVCSDHSIPRAPIPFFGELKVGRQGADDPAPISVDKTNGHKLVIAKSSDASISRTQLTVSVVAGCLARITNGSRNRHFLVEDYGVVAPGDGIYVKFPFTVSLGKVSLLFARE